MSACEKRKVRRKTVQRTRCRAAGLAWVGCVDDVDDDDDGKGGG